ncbi:unnamed protein product [Leuciscus chuanchicus]
MAVSPIPMATRASLKVAVSDSGSCNLPCADSAVFTVHPRPSGQAVTSYGQASLIDLCEVELSGAYPDHLGSRGPALTARVFPLGAGGSMGHETCCVTSQTRLILLSGLAAVGASERCFECAVFGLRVRGTQVSCFLQTLTAISRNTPQMLPSRLYGFMLQKMRPYEHAHGLCSALSRPEQVGPPENRAGTRDRATGFMHLFCRRRDALVCVCAPAPGMWWWWWWWGDDGGRKQATLHLCDASQHLLVETEACGDSPAALSGRRSGGKD